jgi:hypothetical protein
VLLSNSRDRAPLGSCALYVAAPLVTVPLTTSATGTARVPLGVPNDPTLLGGEAFAQWVIADPQGSAFGLLAASDALHLIVGR